MRPSDLTSILAVAGCVKAAQYDLDSSLITANQPFPDAFVSYSIEFASFPDFAGNNTQPNLFSDNLLNNIGNLTGTKPYIRVGGNTQDYALYNASLPYALNGTFDYSRSADYPTTIFIGPSYFESYAQWPNTRFSHGFNLAMGANASASVRTGAGAGAGWQTLLDTVPLACRALSGDDNDGNGSANASSSRLYLWEYGNEPDLYSTAAQGAVRPPAPLGWNASVYVAQWREGARQIRAGLAESCPDLLPGADGNASGFMAPSFAGVGNTLRLPATWAAGLDEDGDVTLVSTHNYISGATTPGVTLANTLLNHTVTMASVDAHIAEYYDVWPDGVGSGPPLIMGETNSLYNEGKPGLSNSFGAALWGVDFNLYCASVGIRRVHMHQGTNYRYASWQPIETVNATIGTKPPYYGNIAVAAFLGNTLTDPVTVAHIPLSDPHEAAYAAYSVPSNTSTTSQLLRAMILNLNPYNTTINGTGLGVAPTTTTTTDNNTTTAPRVTRIYTFDVSAASLPPGALVPVQRLSANGSDALTGIAWDGWSYNYELDEGRPTRLANLSSWADGDGDLVPVAYDGTVAVGVPDAGAAVLRFDWALQGGDWNETTAAV